MVKYCIGIILAGQQKRICELFLCEGFFIWFYLASRVNSVIFQTDKPWWVSLWFVFHHKQWAFLLNMLLPVSEWSLSLVDFPMRSSVFLSHV